MPNLEREREGHDDVCHHDVLQVYDEVRLRGNAEKHPGGDAVERQPQQKEKGVENREDHRLQDVVTGTSAVAVAVIAGEQEGSCISLHEGCLKNRRGSRSLNKNTKNSLILP